jgi:hypothetical protein
MSCDAIISHLSKLRKIKLGFLCTPTDCHPIPEEAKLASEKEFANRWRKLCFTPIRFISNGRWLDRNMYCEPIHSDNGKDYYIVNAIVRRQGPNYVLAKRIQHWRSVLARSEGILVSTNIAPSSATSSVTHQRSFAWAYDGMDFFPPMEIFEEQTSSRLMGALLLHDLLNSQSSANPQVPLENQMEIFSDTAVHGGIWRMAYTMDSITEPSAAVHFVKLFLRSKATKFLVVIMITTPVGYRLYSRL